MTRWCWCMGTLLTGSVPMRAAACVSLRTGNRETTTLYHESVPSRSSQSRTSWLQYGFGDGYDLSPVVAVGDPHDEHGDQRGTDHEWEPDAVDHAGRGHGPQGTDAPCQSFSVNMFPSLARDVDMTDAKPASWIWV